MRSFHFSLPWYDYTRLGLDLAILAISKIKDTINVKFKIVGEGDQYQDLIKLIKDLNIEDRIDILNKNDT